MAFLIHITNLVCIYAILAISLDLLVGQAGLLVLCQAAFFGLGAYLAAILSTWYETPFLIELGLVFVLGALAGLTVAIPSTMVRREQVAITTFSFQMIFFVVIYNWREVTGGALGVVGIKVPRILGWRVDMSFSFTVIVAALALISWILVDRIKRSPLGRLLRAAAVDEAFVESLGKDIRKSRWAAFGVSGAFAAMAGALYAHHFRYIDPSSFDLLESVLIMSMVVIGGAGSRWGPLLGATALVILPEFLRFLGLPPAVAGDLRQLFYGLAMVGLMVLRPSGLLGNWNLRSDQRR